MSDATSRPLPARFGTAISCIDGRVHRPVTDWLREHFQLSYVDLVTYPGVDGLLAGDASDAEQTIRTHVEVSVNGHHSPVVAIVGHAECLGNPVSEDDHRAHVQRAVQRVLDWKLGVTVIGLWVTPGWTIDVVRTRAAA